MRQTSYRTPDEQVIVVSHQAETMKLNSVVLRSYCEKRQELQPVTIIEKYWCLADSAVEDMMPATLRVLPARSSHTKKARNGV